MNYVNLTGKNVVLALPGRGTLNVPPASHRMGVRNGRIVGRPTVLEANTTYIVTPAVYDKILPRERIDFLCAE